MADIVRKEPVLIENVNLIINVFNIGTNEVVGDQGQAGFLSDRLGELSKLQPSNISPEAPKRETTENNDYPQLPLGWIATHDGDTIPFGVMPTAEEIPKFGDPVAWKEVRVSLPASLLADVETDLYCPVSSCRERLSRHKSMDSHIKKHLGLGDKKSGLPINTNNEGDIPCPLVYYCHAKECQYYVEIAEKSFKAYKNIKQHYQKVHAPKLFNCDLCKKTFSTLKVAESHVLMCGEKYSCSTCNASYNSLEVLQTHCRRKSHVYDHGKYKDKRNLVKQGMQSMKSTSSPAAPPVPNPPIRKSKGSRKGLPVLLPKVNPTSDSQVFSSIQALCQQAGVKVDYGCQTVCTAIIQKGKQVEAIITQQSPSATQKKRKSTDTQTNIFKFRATCLDPKHNATNTNLDWKKVITSDSETQTAENSDSVVLSASKLETGNDSSVLVNDEFATIKISETAPNPKSQNVETNPIPSIPPAQPEVKNNKSSEDCNSSAKPCPSASDSAEAPINKENGPSLSEEFISFLEATDSATQTDPDIFEVLGGNHLGIQNLEEVSGTEQKDYVSVSSTASQTAVENIPTMSLSAEDYEALLSTTYGKMIADIPVLGDLVKSADSVAANATPAKSEAALTTEENDEIFDWEDIVDEVYRDQDGNSKVSQL